LELAILSDEISLDLEEAVRFGEEMGFRKYEIRCLDDYEHRVPDFRPGRVDRLHQLVAEGRMEITALTPGVFKIHLSDTDKLRRELEDILPRTCELARRLGVPRIISFGFMRETGVPESEARDRLREAGEVVREHGLELVVENEPGSFCDTGVNTARLVGDLQMDHVGINWDPANAVISGEAAYPVGYCAVRPLLRNMHVKDSIPLPPDKWENRLLGDGGVNWVGQLAALRRDRPLPHITLETHVFPLLDSTRETLRRIQLLMATAAELSVHPET